MNSVMRLLVDHDEGVILLSGSAKGDIQVAVLGYLFRAIDSSTLSTVLKENLDWTGSQCAAFRASLTSSGFHMKVLKAYMYRRFLGEKGVLEVEKDDVKLITKAFKAETPLAKALQKTLRRNMRLYGSLPIAQFDAMINAAMANLKDARYCEKFVGKKFKFLTQSGQKDKESIIADLQGFALRAVYFEYPKFQSEQHLLNIMKRAIHNRGINIIKEETTAGRNRVVQNDDKTFSGTILSLNYGITETLALNTPQGQPLSTCTALMCGTNGQACEGERPTDVDRRADLERIVDILLASFTGRARKFVQLLMGLHHDGFSAFLGGPNDDLILKMGHKAYVYKAQAFSELSDRRAKLVVEQLRSHLMDFRN